MFRTTPLLVAGRGVGAAAVGRAAGRHRTSHLRDHRRGDVGVDGARGQLVDAVAHPVTSGEHHAVAPARTQQVGGEADRRIGGDAGETSLPPLRRATSSEAGNGLAPAGVVACEMLLACAGSTSIIDM